LFSCSVFISAQEIKRQQKRGRGGEDVVREELTQLLQTHFVNVIAHTHTERHFSTFVTISREFTMT
jgi:hypothetical protein